MVASLKGSLKQTFNTMGAGSDEELQADVQASFGIWTVDPGQVIANEITREQEEELTAGEADASLPVEQRDRNEGANEETMVEQAYELPEPPVEPTDLDNSAGVDASEKALEQKRIELDRGEGAQAAGLMSTNVQGGAEKLSLQEKEKKERQFSELLQRLEQQRRVEKFFEDIENHYRKKQKEAEDNAQKMELDNEKIMGDMMKNADFIGQGERLLKDHKDGKQVDRQAVVDLLKSRNKPVNDNMPLGALMRVLEGEVKTTNEQNAGLDQQYKQNEDQIAKLREQAKKNGEMADKIHEKREECKSRNLSPEETEKVMAEIWDTLPDEDRKDILRTYQDSHGSTQEIEKEVQEKVETRNQEAPEVDPMAVMMQQMSAGPKI